jgi:hypothetical protein
MPSTSKNSLAISSSPQADVGVAIPENKSETRMPAESGAQLEPDIEAARRDGLITAEEAAELGKADTDSAAQQSALQAAAMCVARGVL